MSAREKLLRVLRGQEEECYCDNPHCTSPEVLVDAYAHELAEKLRDRHSGTCGCGCDCSEFIDPEVLNSGS